MDEEFSEQDTQPLDGGTLDRADYKELSKSVKRTEDALMELRIAYNMRIERLEHAIIDYDQVLKELRPIVGEIYETLKNAADNAVLLGRLYAKFPDLDRNIKNLNDLIESRDTSRRG